MIAVEIKFCLLDDENKIHEADRVYAFGNNKQVMKNELLHGCKTAIEGILREFYEEHPQGA